MLPRDHQHLVINFSIVMDEKVKKIGHKDLLLVEVSRKGGDACGINSLRSGSSRVCRLVNLNTEHTRPVVRWTAPSNPSIADLAVSALGVRGVMMLKGYSIL